MTINDSDFEDKADSPRKVVTDEGTVVERNVDELIKADQYTAAKQSATDPLHGLRISRFKPGGAA